MFTGIVSAVGSVVEAGDGRIAIDDEATATRLKKGGSVAINGCCLTVVTRKGSVFYADVVPETGRRTNLGGLKPGDSVNLELPLTAASTLDGHLVQGHVDAAATVISVDQAASGREINIELPPSIAKFVAEKGSIAVDGVSLTVATVDHSSFRVALIPHTLEHTIAGGYKIGSKVNIEADVIARYVARNLPQ
jgi:riboflavin synthase